MKKSFLLTFLLAVFITPTAQAASVSAALDWSRFGIDFLNGSGSYWIDYEQGEAQAQVLDDLSNYALSQDEHTASSGWGGLIASASIDKAFLANAVANYGLVGSVYNHASANSTLGGVATLSKGTTALFSVPYVLSASVASSGLEDTYGYVSLFACSQGDLYCSNLRYAEVLLDNISVDTETSEERGILELEITNTTSDTIYVNWGAVARVEAFTSAAAVPEPGVFSMFLLSLGLMIGAVRRRVSTAT